MEIKVEGKGAKAFRPNQINFRIEFNEIEQTQSKAVERGLEDVKKYVDFLTSVKIKKEKIQTNSMTVSQNRVYNEKLRSYENKGFRFNQSIKIKLDYDLKLLSCIVAETAKFKNPPAYYMSFSLKDEDKAKEEVLALAYKDAELQAKAIATGAGKQIKECVSVSFEPFSSLMSTSNFGYEREFAYEKASKIQDNIEATFVPTDVNVEKTIYCVFTTKEGVKTK